MKVAIVSDWLLGGGAERVVYELHRLFPDAPIYTSYCSPEWRQRLDNQVVTGYLQHWPFRPLRKFLPVLRIHWFSRLDLSDYDLVISCTGNGEAKGIRVGAGARHICYCYTPVHFYWRHYDQYLRNPGFGWLNPLARLGLRLLVKPLRRWDYRAAQRPDMMIAISEHIKADIKRYYDREAVVINPPVDVKRFSQATAAERKGFVTVSRLVPAKRVDIIVQACTELERPLRVIGRGPELGRLQRLAGPTVSFLTDVSDEDMPAQLASAEAFIFASHEDFGVAPVEALAAGTPVIAYQAGGALDYVTPGKTGLFFAEQTVESLADALQAFDGSKFDRPAIRSAAARFSAEEFARKIKSLAEES